MEGRPGDWGRTWLCPGDSLLHTVMSSISKEVRGQVKIEMCFSSCQTTGKYLSILDSATPTILKLRLQRFVVRAGLEKATLPFRYNPIKRILKDKKGERIESGVRLPNAWPRHCEPVIFTALVTFFSFSKIYFTKLCALVAMYFDNFVGDVF